MYNAARKTYIIGLSMGQPHETTGLAVVERIDEGEERAYLVRHLERFPHRTTFADIAARLLSMVSNPPLQQTYSVMRGPHGRARREYITTYPTVVLDATSVGQPVAKLFQHGPLAELGVWVNDVMITAADVETNDNYVRRVPKRDLASILQMQLQAGRLRVAETLALAEAFVSELRGFRVKVSLNPTDDSIAWREGANDDLVLAVACAVWHEERFGGLGPKRMYALERALTEALTR